MKHSVSRARPRRNLAGTGARRGAGLLAMLAGLCLAGAAQAQSIDVELNRLQDIENGCRLNLVFTNRTGAPVTVLGVETVLFDKEGRVERFLLLRTRDLSTGKIRVEQYDVPELACQNIGRVLLNDVSECEGDGLDPATCLDRLRLSSRETADFLSSVAAPAAPAASDAEAGGQPAN